MRPDGFLAQDGIRCIWEDKESEKMCDKKRVWLRRLRIVISTGIWMAAVVILLATPGGVEAGEVTRLQGFLQMVGSMLVMFLGVRFSSYDLRCFKMLKE